jgi:hypothetical protein
MPRLALRDFVSRRARGVGLGLRFACSRVPHTHSAPTPRLPRAICLFVLARARPDAKVAFAGDEGAGIQIAVEGGVYAEEERW